MAVADTFPLADVPGVSECTLSGATLAQLPAEAPAAPWQDLRLTSILWLARGGRTAGRAAGAANPSRGRALAVIGGLISYADTPVGPYHEVLGAVGLRAGRAVRNTVPFMAVDSPASLVGGHTNWSLPKTLAQFTGEPADGEMSARGEGWTVRVRARPYGPSMPIPMSGRIVQPWPDGTLCSAGLAGKGRGRSAIVTVEVESDGELPSWLRPGRHVGAVVSQASFTMQPAVSILNAGLRAG
jgi:hypothetical protein